MKKIKLPLIVLLIAILVLVALIIWQSSKEEKEKNILISDTEINIPIQNVVNEEFVEVKKDGTKVNTSNKLKEVKNFDGLTVTNITLETKNNETIVRAVIKNPTKDSKGDYSIKLKIKNKEGNIIKEIGGYVNHIEARRTN